MPLSLSGVRRIMERMDWGDAGAFVGFGDVGADQITADCDFYILIAPQNVVGAELAVYVSDMHGVRRCVSTSARAEPRCVTPGNTIMTNLLEMVRMGPCALAVWLPRCKYCSAIQACHACCNRSRLLRRRGSVSFCCAPYEAPPWNASACCCFR